MKSTAWLVFVVAALLEVGGDAAVRCGLRGRSAIWILLGCATLACYGLVVNSVKWDFSRLLGVYVGVFAALSVLFGRFAFRESIPGATWCGLALIILGGLIIQFGH
jgi:small multidrug resistance family-3 protein